MQKRNAEILKVPDYSKLDFQRSPQIDFKMSQKGTFNKLFNRTIIFNT